MDQKYFLQPFGFAGDQTVIPDPLQVSGQVSFNQGWTFDYQRDQSTDAAAKPIDRSTMNYLMYVITQQLAQYQQHSMPEWISAANNGGTAYGYAKHSKVRYSATVPGVTFETYVSIIDGNTDTPGATANWQLFSDQVATSAQATAGTDTRNIITSALLAQQTSLRALLAGSSGQVFNTAAATAASHATNLGQFSSSLGPNGWGFLPDGRMEQWGFGTITGTGVVTFSFVTPFPNAAYTVTGNFATPAQGNLYLAPIASNTTQFTAQSSYTGAGQLFYWNAKGK